MRSMSATIEQLEVISNPNESKLVIALPGSGKTFTSIELASKILENPNNRLLMVTFTNAATNEMRERLSAKVSSRSLEKTDISTFASIMNRQAESIKKGRKLCIGSERNMLVSRVLNSEAVTKRILQLINYPLTKQNGRNGYKLPKAGSEQWSQWKQYTEQLPELFDLECSTYPEPEANDSPVSIAYQEYKRLMRESRRMDLDMVAKGVVGGLLGGAIKPLEYTHIIVDEFQDTDYLQYLWLHEHQYLGGTHVTVVGDDDQSIYGWRGARGVENMASFLRECEAKQYALQTCFRCAPEILSIAAKLIQRNKHRIGKEMRSGAKAGGEVILKEFTGEELKKLLSDDRIEEILKGIHGSKWREHLQKFLREPLPTSLQPESYPLVASEIAKEPEGWAILARTNQALDELEVELCLREINVLRIGGKKVWDNERLLALLQIMYGVCFGNDPAILCSGLSYLGESEDVLREVASQMRRTRNFSFAENNEGLWSETTRLIHNNASDFSAAKNDKDAPAVFSSMLGAITSEITNASQRRAVEHSWSWLQKIVLQQRGLSVRECVASVFRSTRKSNREQETTNDDGVVLCTMSSSKGLEWEKVWIINAERSRIPAKIGNKMVVEGANHPAWNDDVEHLIEEERRVLYVAMTRAERKLVMSFREGRCSAFLSHDLGYGQYS